jgi:hypothetical protein
MRPFPAAIDSQLCKNTANLRMQGTWRALSLFLVENILLALHCNHLPNTCPENSLLSIHKGAAPFYAHCPANLHQYSPAMTQGSLQQNTFWSSLACRSHPTTHLAVLARPSNPVFAGLIVGGVNLKSLAPSIVHSLHQEAQHIMDYSASIWGDNIQDISCMPPRCTNATTNLTPNPLSVLYCALHVHCCMDCYILPPACCSSRWENPLHPLWGMHMMTSGSTKSVRREACTPQPGCVPHNFNG